LHSGIRKLIARATAAKWKPGAPGSPSDILKAETQLGITFPEDYRDYLAAGGLFQKNATPRGLWKLDEIVSLNRTMPIFRWFRGVVGIGNEGITVYGYDFRDTPILVSFALSASDWADVNEESKTFESWLQEALGFSEM
jgi:hypothetical protein